MRKGRRSKAPIGKRVRKIASGRVAMAAAPGSKRKPQPEEASRLEVPGGLAARQHQQADPQQGLQDQEKDGVGQQQAEAAAEKGLDAHEVLASLERDEERLGSRHERSLKAASTLRGPFRTGLVRTMGWLLGGLLLRPCLRGETYPGLTRTAGT